MDQQTPQKPSIGRIVHYVAYGTPNGEYKPEHRAAVITHVHNDTNVGLCVLNPAGMFFNASNIYDNSETPAGGTWHYPERV